MELLKSGSGQRSTTEGARCTTHDLWKKPHNQIIKNEYKHTQIILSNLDMDVVTGFQHHFGSILTFYFLISKHYGDIAITPTRQLQIGPFANLCRNAMWGR